jgi:hypothetical protein
VDSACEQEKLEARKMLENVADSPASSARFVGRMDWFNYTCSGGFSRHFLQKPFSKWGGSALEQVHF